LTQYRCVTDGRTERRTGRKKCYSCRNTTISFFRVA